MGSEVEGEREGGGVKGSKEGGGLSAHGQTTWGLHVALRGSRMGRPRGKEDGIEQQRLNAKTPICTVHSVVWVP